MRNVGTAALILTLVSCSSPSGHQSNPDAETDARFRHDVGADGGGEGADAGLDAGGDLGTDTGAATCEFPLPTVAGTPETNALADAPARCGMDSYAWLRDESLGEVIELGTSQTFPAVLINNVADSESIELPREVSSDVFFRQFTYRTQDRGELIEASAGVAVPVERRGEDLPVLLMLHGTSGFADQCGPSGMLEGQALPVILASFGYLVVAPDYIGMKPLGEATGFPHPYLVGEATAIASLDAVRAAANLPAEERRDVCPTPTVSVMGFSQGGHAALWVERLAPYYARELDLVGGVAGVPPIDLIGEIERALTSVVPATGNTIAVLATQAPWYGYGDRLDEVFVSPWDVDVPQALDESCNPGDDVTEPDTLEDLFQSELLQAAQAGTFADLDPWGCMIAENGLTTTSVGRLDDDAASDGWLIVTGEADALVNTPTERDAFVESCEAGLPWSYLECAGAEHVDANIWALSEMLDFIDARLAGDSFETDCSTPLVTCSGTPE
jgi:dienelactone hydrolase